MSKSRICDDSRSFAGNLSKLKDRINMFLPVLTSGTISQLDIGTHRENSKVCFDSTQESCRCTSRIGHLKINAVSLRSRKKKNFSCCALFKAKVSFFSPLTSQHKEIFRKTKLCLPLLNTPELPFALGSTFQLPPE